MKKLTIVTPTYNRQKTLSKLYESLIQQTCNDFIWLIIDDGSTDNTRKMVNEFTLENKISIKYYYKKNGGKASALNKALDIIKTKYCCCLDSDDYFDKKTVEISISLLEKEDNNKCCCGIVALRNKPNGEILGSREIPDNAKYISIADIYYIFNIRKTELICFYKSDIAKQYRFPTFEGEKFVSPTWFQLVLSKKYNFRATKEKLCYCEYFPDGLSMNKIKIITQNPKGYTEVKRMHLESSPNLFYKFKNAIMYDCGCIISNDKNWIKNSPHRIICLLSIPIAYIAYYKRFKMIKKTK